MSDATTTQETTPPIPTFLEICAGWHKATENLDKFNRMLTTDAKIAQTPKEQIWALNKAKLYRTSDGEVKSYPIYLKDILERGKLETNYKLAPGDIISVPERSF